MRLGPRSQRVFGRLLLAANLFSAGCSALVAYSGQDVSKLANKQQVRQSFGTPIRSGIDGGAEFEDYRTRRKISEPTVAGVNLILGAETLGLFELWMFPAAVLRNSWTTLVGQTVRFEYSDTGEVRRVLIDGTPMKERAGLP